MMESGGQTSILLCTRAKAEVVSCLAWQSGRTRVDIKCRVKFAMPIHTSRSVPPPR